MNYFSNDAFIAKFIMHKAHACVNIASLILAKAPTQVLRLVLYYRLLFPYI